MNQTPHKITLLFKTEEEANYWYRTYEKAKTLERGRKNQCLSLGNLTTLGGPVVSKPEPEKPKSIPSFPNAKLFSEEQARNGTVRNSGYAVYNYVPHLCVDVPDENFTISAKTSSGQQITFAFLTYRDGAPPQCVDVEHHTTVRKVKNGDALLPCISTIHFGYNKPDVRVIEEMGYSKVCVLIHDQNNEKETK